MIFILVLVFLGAQANPMTVTADFSSEATCLRVRNEVTAAYKLKGRESYLLTANCFPK